MQYCFCLNAWINPESQHFNYTNCFQIQSDGAEEQNNCLTLTNTNCQRLLDLSEYLLTETQHCILYVRVGKSGNCWTSSTLQTTDQSLRLKLSISIYPGLPSNWIKGMACLHQCYTINWYHLAQKEDEVRKKRQRWLITMKSSGHTHILWYQFWHNVLLWFSKTIFISQG